MHIPRVKLHWSWVYNEHFKKIYKENDYPTGEEIAQFMKKLQKQWELHGKAILKSLTTITQLSWEEKDILCYVVGRTNAFSDPMTIPAHLGYEDYAIDVITHELIHRIFIQSKNYARMEPYWEWLQEKYKNIPYNSMLHIPVLAFHTKLYKELFDEERLKRDKTFLKMPDYKKAWDIIEKDGEDAIIKEFLVRRQ